MHDAVKLRESKVVVIVTVPGETPITTPREFTMAILSSELSNTGLSAVVFGFKSRSLGEKNRNLIFHKFNTYCIW
mgnify:CR=1 FL=1